MRDMTTTETRNIINLTTLRSCSLSVLLLKSLSKMRLENVCFSVIN